MHIIQYPSPSISPAEEPTKLLLSLPEMPRYAGWSVARAMVYSYTPWLHQLQHPRHNKRLITEEMYEGDNGIGHCVQNSVLVNAGHIRGERRRAKKCFISWQVGEGRACLGDSAHGSQKGRLASLAFPFRDALSASSFHAASTCNPIQSIRPSVFHLDHHHVTCSLLVSIPTPARTCDAAIGAHAPRPTSAARLPRVPPHPSQVRRGQAHV